VSTNVVKWSVGEVEWSVVKWSEGLKNRLSINITGYKTI
jgi:hypothetical protein